ncbi:thiamine phosphate synthase [Erysipelotrichaceae bacterium MTC7]|nr:thiamine phosphate synthase [Erysipelotrichaceae bacterium MTC7]
MKQTTVDYGIYLITDQTVLGKKDLCEAVEQAILGGCTLVQIREKEQSTKAFYQEAKQIKAICDRYKVPLIVNDRVDVALAIDASGIHVGQDDLPACITRKLIGKNKLLGVSVTNLDEALQAQRDDADYLGVGAMHATQTKEDATIVSLAQLANIRAAVEIPIVVIGGISVENASMYAQMQVDGLAVVSAILSQKDIYQATKTLKQAFQAKS